MQPFDIFVVISGGFSILATVPLVYLAACSYRDGRELHRVQLEVAELMGEVREIQTEIHREQREASSELTRTKETVQRVEAATAKRRRLPRMRFELNPDDH